MPSLKILTIGGATQDIFIQYNGSDSIEMVTHGFTHCFLLLEEGQKVEVNSLEYHLGGGAANTAVSFARQGFETALFCKLGNDYAATTIKNQLAQEKINLDSICLSSCNKTATSFIIQSKTGERTVFAYRGATTTLAANEIPYARIEQSDFLYITSLGVRAWQTLPTIVKHARKHKVRIATNPGSIQLSDGAETFYQSLAGIEVLIMNLSEVKLFMRSLCNLSSEFKKKLMEEPFSQPREASPTITPSHDQASPYLIDHPIQDDNDHYSLRNFFTEMLEIGPKVVIITNDKNGVYCAFEETIYYHPALLVKPISTVGAGDAFGSAFCGSYFKGASIEESLRNGALNSASVLGHVGAQTGLMNDIMQREQLLMIDQSLLKKYRR
jgi:ribokinase